MRTPTRAIVAVILLLLLSQEASAQLTSAGVLDKVVTEFATRASTWATVVSAAASRLFWSLVTISLVWNFGMMALRKADIGDFFAEFIRFTFFTGLFWWALTNGPAMATSIIASMKQIGAEASGSESIGPSGVVDVGFLIFSQALRNTSAWSPIDSLVGLTLSLGILVMLAIIAVNMLLLLVSAWILAYAGVFFLGFGGARWTSDMAVNYFKTVIGLGMQIMTMILLVGIGNDLLSDFYAKMSTGSVNFEELAVMLVVCMALLILVNRIPPLLAGIITGASVGGGGIGQLGAGAALGAAGVAAAAAATGGALVGAGLAGMGGGIQAVMAAVAKAQTNVSAGTDILSTLGGALGGGSGSGSSAGSGSSSQSTPLAEAAGYAAAPTPSSLAPTAAASASESAPSGESPTGGDAGNAESPPATAMAEPQGQGPTESTAAPDGEGGTSNGASAQTDAPAKTTGGGRGSKVGRVAVDAAANLAKGTGSVAAAKFTALQDALKGRLADTTGGKIAAAIRGDARGADKPIDKEQEQERGEADSSLPVTAEPTFGGNSLGGATEPIDVESEVAAFVQRGEASSTRSS